MRQIDSAKVFSPTPAHREGFARKIGAKTGVPVKPVDQPELAAKDVDIILCMTNTNVPVINGSWLEEGQYIISVIGSNIELVKSGTSMRRAVRSTTKPCAGAISSWRYQRLRRSIRSKGISTGPCKMA